MRSELRRDREWVDEPRSRTSIDLDTAKLVVVKTDAVHQGKSSRKAMMEFSHLKKKYWGQHIWARGYFAVTVGNLNEQQVQEYIENQEVHHRKDNFEISTH